MALAGSALSVTLLAVVAGLGMLPEGEQAGAAGSADVAGAADSDNSSAMTGSSNPTASATPSQDAPLGLTGTQKPPRSKNSEHKIAPGSDDALDDLSFEALPANSGDGRRVVYSEIQQRVWLVEDDDTVDLTYPVSGSIYDSPGHDNLKPGTYEVYSRSEDAVGIEDSGTMKYFVRFTRGPSGAAIGFHDIPIDDGTPLQTKGQLGTPQSHGCIRQSRADAIRLWEFAPLGTTVVVVA